MVLIKGEILQGSPCALVAAVERIDNGNLVVQADVTSISVTITDTQTKTQTGSFTPDKTVVVFDTPQGPDVRSPSPYNFSIVIPGSYFPNAPTTYMVVVTVTPTSGPVYPIAAAIKTTQISFT